MSCNSPSRELLTFWLAGTLSPAEAALVADHVAGCSDCRQAAIEGVALVKGLRDLHLRADEIVAAAAGEIRPPHLLVCSRCRDEVVMLRDVNTDLTNGSRVGRASGGSVRSVVPGNTSFRYWSAPIIALAAAAVVLVVWIGPRREAGDTTLRGGTLTAVEQLTATTMADGVPAFSWTPLAAATNYRVAVFSEDGRPVWTREIVAPPTRWPADVLRNPGSYRWRIEALNAGAVIARSRLAELEVAR